MGIRAAPTDKTLIFSAEETDMKFCVRKTDSAKDMGTSVALGLIFCACVLVFGPELVAGQTFQWGSNWGPGSKRAAPEGFDPDAFAAFHESLGLPGQTNEAGAGRCAISPHIKKAVSELLQYEWSRIKSICPEGGRFRPESATSRKPFKNP